MNKWLVMMLGFAFVIGTGVIVIMISERTDEEVAAETSILSGVRLTQHGQKICQSEINEAIGTIVYSPSSSTGDRMTTVSLTWEGQSKKYRKIECTYNIDHGVVTLIVDGKTIIAK